MAWSLLGSEEQNGSGRDRSTVAERVGWKGGGGGGGDNGNIGSSSATRCFKYSTGIRLILKILQETGNVLIYSIIYIPQYSMCIVYIILYILHYM